MKKYILLVLAMALFLISCQKTSQSIKYAENIASSEMQRHQQAWQLDYLKQPKWTYTIGLELGAFIDLYKVCGDNKYLDYATAYADTMVNADGSIKTYKLEDYNIDQLNAGKILFPIYGYTKKVKYRKAIELLHSQMNTHPRNADGSFWHKKVYPHQIWLDGIYMGSPFLAQYGKVFNHSEDFNVAVNQIITAARHTYDPSTGLYRHACDVSKQMFWADSVTGQSKHAWGRAMGWYAMAIVDVLDYLPENQPGRDSVLKILNNIAFQLKRIQNPATGLWYQVLDHDSTGGNYLESSCSAMFIYSLLKAVRMGYIDSSYKNVAIKGYRGFIRQFVTFDNKGLMNINQTCAVAGLGGSDKRSGDFNYYVHEKVRSNDAKAIGPFIKACIEIEKSK